MSRRTQQGDAEAMRREMNAYAEAHGPVPDDAHGNGTRRARAHARRGARRGGGGDYDADEEDPSNWVTASAPTRGGGGGGGGGAYPEDVYASAESRAFRGGEMAADEQEAYARSLADRNVATLRETRATLQDAQRVGAATAAKAAEQGEQLRRVEDDLDHTNHTLSLSQRVLGGMRSMGTAFGNMFKSKPKPPPPRDTRACAGEHDGSDGSASDSGASPVVTGGRGSAGARGGAGGFTGAADPGAGSKSLRVVGESSGGIGGATASEDATLSYVAARRKEEDEILAGFSSDLDELKRISQTLNKELKDQGQTLGRIDDKMSLAHGRMKDQTKTMERLI
jgi:hypothetical protein